MLCVRVKKLANKLWKKHCRIARFCCDKNKIENIRFEYKIVDATTPRGGEVKLLMR